MKHWPVSASVSVPVARQDVPVARQDDTVLLQPTGNVRPGWSGFYCHLLHWQACFSLPMKTPRWTPSTSPWVRRVNPLKEAVLGRGRGAVLCPLLRLWVRKRVNSRHERYKSFCSWINPQSKRGKIKSIAMCLGATLSVVKGDYTSSKRTSCSQVSTETIPLNHLCCPAKIPFLIFFFKYVSRNHSVLVPRLLTSIGLHTHQLASACRGYKVSLEFFYLKTPNGSFCTLILVVC